MASISVKIDPIERDIAVILEEELSPKARSLTLASAAREAITEAEAVNRSVLGRVPTHDVYVDGRKGAPLESVRPDGTILVEFDLISETLDWIGEMLVKHSPFLTGRYSRSHVFLADGELIQPGAPVPNASEYVFTNLQPYARRIERGWSPQTPDGVYEVVAAMANRRFSNIARIRFGYRSPLFGGIHAWASTTRMASPGRRGAKREEWLRRQPSVIVVPR